VAGKGEVGIILAAVSRSILTLLVAVALAAFVAGCGGGGSGSSSAKKTPATSSVVTAGTALPAGTSGSQFFVVTAADAGLPPEYAIVGKVTGGKDVVDRIATMPTTDSEQPIVPVVIQKATLQAT
jgi:hypothetical protein